VPSVVAARKRIAGGAVGRVQQSRACWLQDRPSPGLWERGDWFLTPDTSGGGPLIDLGIHKLDQALYLLGHPPVQSVTGFTSRGIGREVAATRGKAYELEDYAFGLIRFADESILTVEASYFLNVPGTRQETSICGTTGVLDIENKTAILTTWSSEEPTQTALGPDTKTAVNCVEHFCRVLRKEEDLIPTPEQGLLALQIVDTVYRSAETGRPVLDVFDASPRTAGG